MRGAFQTFRDLLVAVGPFALLAGGLLYAAFRFLAPMPPKVVTLA
ncbi:MAG: C4-dicarboxylate ABC transporter substrate-binding protein, partial [Burkholderiaceae bacterium]